MKVSFAQWLISKMSQWLLKNAPPKRTYLCDFDEIKREIKPGDVILVEGRNRISNIIQQMTKSPWSHAAMFIGKISDLTDGKDQERITTLHPYPKDTLLLVESEVGEGTIISPIDKYKDDHIRLLRPMGLSQSDTQRVIHHALTTLGRKYSIRHVFDLARFILPWGYITGYWRSTLFEKQSEKPTEDICSSMIADAFHSINYPILPLVQRNAKENMELIQRNPRLFTPSDFDYSPYFNVIKYPIFKLGTLHSLEDLPWRKGLISYDIEIKNDPTL